MTNQSTIDKLIEMHLTAMSDAFIIQKDDPKMKDVPFEDRHQRNPPLGKRLPILTTREAKYATICWMVDLKPPTTSQNAV